MGKLDVMQTKAYRLPYPTTLHVFCSHRERDDIVAIQTVQVVINKNKRPDVSKLQHVGSTHLQTDTTSIELLHEI